jgi:hypothetical protein
VVNEQLMLHPYLERSSTNEIIVIEPQFDAPPPVSELVEKFNPPLSFSDHVVASSDVISICPTELPLQRLTKSLNIHQNPVGESSISEALPLPSKDMHPSPFVDASITNPAIVQQSGVVADGNVVTPAVGAVEHVAIDGVAGHDAHVPEDADQFGSPHNISP